MVKTSFVQAYNTYILMTASYAWANTKHIHQYAKRTEKFMPVYTKQKQIVYV